jgi:hypothetical protein
MSIEKRQKEKEEKEEKRERGEEGGKEERGRKVGSRLHPRPSQYIG